MRGRAFRIVSAALLSLAWLAAAEAVNMSGTWVLNTTKSKWGNKTPAPHDERIQIEHSEPKLKYSGWVQRNDGPDNAFDFDGAIDNKPHQIENGTIKFRRIGPNSVESVMNSNHGTYEETAITTISSDGKTMTRHIQAKSPNGTIAWTEVYDKVS